MSLILESNDWECTTCGSDILGHTHTKCGNVVCACEPCPKCYADDEGPDLEDPTPWCSWCGARNSSQCDCGPRADND